MRLIDADQFLIDESEAYMSAQNQIQDMELRFLNNLVHQKIQMLIMDAPTVATDTNVARKGKWYRLTDCANEGTYCSNCHAKIFEDVFKHHAKKLSKFCPNCGADMRGAEDDN